MFPPYRQRKEPIPHPWAEIFDQSPWVNPILPPGPNQWQVHNYYSTLTKAPLKWMQKRITNEIFKVDACWTTYLPGILGQNNAIIPQASRAIIRARFALKPANTNHFTNANFCSPQSSVGAKNCKSSELIRQNVTEQHYFAPTEAWNWQKFVLVKWRINSLNSLITEKKKTYNTIIMPVRSVVRHP